MIEIIFFILQIILNFTLELSDSDSLSAILSPPKKPLGNYKTKSDIFSEFICTEL